MSGGSHIERLTYSNTDTNKMVWKALTYGKLEYAPHLNYHPRNGGIEVRLVQSVTSSGRSTHSTERTCNVGNGWQLVYHTKPLSCLASLRAAPSATNHVCQTPPWTPATSILYYGSNDWPYQLQKSSAVYHWLSGSCYIKGPQCLQNIW
jgi:hypothetical protein